VEQVLREFQESVHDKIAVTQAQLQDALKSEERVIFNVIL